MIAGSHIFVLGAFSWGGIEDLQNFKLFSFEYVHYVSNLPYSRTLLESLCMLTIGKYIVINIYILILHKSIKLIENSIWKF